MFFDDGSSNTWNEEECRELSSSSQRTINYPEGVKSISMRFRRDGSQITFHGLRMYDVDSTMIVDEKWSDSGDWSEP